ncbi:MAG: helicase-related protein, partial [Ilumatobacteraceae bacterium]
PSRLDVVDLLDDHRMLPAIYFIFSRNQCDEAARAVLAGGARLTTGGERERIREIVDERLGGLSTADLAVLGYGQFLAQLEAGVAAHHAGMIPPFKEVVEACFVEGLVKVVFATETLAVGINMPARTVVIEKLSKFTGDHHTLLTPGEYTQLTGRAGRRGLDDRGTAVVVWNPFVQFEQVAILAASRSFHLNSVFRPTYNMAANLVRSYTSERAHHLLNLSFAQYQADRDIVKLEARLERRQRHLVELTEAAASPFGDVDDFRRRRDAAARAPSTPVNGRDDPITLAMMRLRPGDIVYAQKGRYAGRVAVLTTAHRKGGVRLTGVTTRRDTVVLSALDFDEPPTAIGRVDLPADFSPTRHEFQKEVAIRLQRADVVESPRHRHRRVAEDLPVTHPVEDDPDLEARLKASAQAERVAREVDDLRRRVAGRAHSVARDFDRVLDVLQRWGYTDDWRLTEAGDMLSRLFHESDLLVAECLRRGLLDELSPAELAGLVSVFVYEHRSPEPAPEPWFPSTEVRRRARAIASVSTQLQADEEAHGLSVHRAPDPTFIAVAYAWAAGEGFAEVVEAEELSGGDFVRTTKQLIDVLRQLAQVAPVAGTRRSAEAAAAALFRGVVAASSEVDGAAADAEPVTAGTEDGRPADGGAVGTQAGGDP